MKKSKIMGTGDVDFAVQGPSVTENGGDAGVKWVAVISSMRVSSINGEMAHVITTFDVDYDSGLFGDPLRYNSYACIHQVSRAYRGNATAYSE